MAGAHVGLEIERVGVGLGGAELRHPLGRLPIGDARIGEAGEREDRRIVLGARPARRARRRRCGRKSARRVDRVAPFGPFGRGERQGVVEHGVEHVDERHLGDDAGPEVGPQVGDGAHQHAAGRAALGDDAGPWRCSRSAISVSAAAMKSVKVLALCSRRPFRYQAIALVHAAADMGDGVDEAAIDERQLRDREAGGHRRCHRRRSRRAGQGRCRRASRPLR